MKPSSVKKVFGIISYFPNNDSDYHIEMRRERSRRFKELLAKIEEYWSDIDIMVIAQNWQDFQLPTIKNKVTVYHYGRLGILGARKELRRRFLDTQYDYMIMMDDDAMLSSDNPQAVIDEIDNHPDGFIVIHKRPSPLVFCAISKFIYSQVEMPDVDAEKGQGFEDDVFTATCFAMFPDRCFLFPEGIIKESSFRYNGPGKCPSTWARERKYDWNHMREFTKNTVYDLEHPIIEDEIPDTDITPSIDLIITYVNGSDRNWINDYIKATRTHIPTPVRYRSWGTLKYLFRGVHKYMPFVRNIILVVSRQSQIPVWINRSNVRIVYHEDYISKNLLPTFNSCTIESFLWNIPDLSDKVIYFNDDMFPISLLSESDFFTGNTPHIKFTEIESYSERNIFRSQCRSSLDVVSNAMGLPKFEKGKLFRPYHISGAFIRDNMIKVGEMCRDALISASSNLRMPKNTNQYIYSYYQYFINDYINETVDYKYFELCDKTIEDAMDNILRSRHKMVCLNDSDRLKDYARVKYQLQSCFDRKFPNKCKYEL